MKKIITISMVFILACSFLFIGNTKAEAMNNESAAMLAGAIAIFGKPVLNAIGREIFYPAPYYDNSYYGDSYYSNYYSDYPTSYYPARTTIIYTSPGYSRHYRYGRDSYKRGWDRDCDHEYGYSRGRHDRWRGDNNRYRW